MLTQIIAGDALEQIALKMRDECRLTFKTGLANGIAKKEEEAGKKKEEEVKKEEPLFEILANPARVMRPQLQVSETCSSFKIKVRTVECRNPN